MLVCPICGESLNKSENALKCQNNHCFDFAKEGYVNLLVGSKSGDKTGDSKESARARHAFLQKGYYSCLKNTIAEKMNGTVLDICCGDGYYDNYDGELYGFDNLNFPPNHPARESMDTYWLEGHDKGECWDKLCLRPHLTGGSVRYMQTHKPPYRFVYPGRVYRNETTDARHERAFFQYEALIVDKDFTFASGKVMIKSILSKVFGRDVPVRMRAGFFPFVEPGFEIDMGCLVCGGKGCSVCKHVGWIEIMPGGTPHPNVLRAAGLDPDEYTGFYVNIGLDRLVMMRYGVDDVRLFHSADLRFLRQFH